MTRSALTLCSLIPVLGWASVSVAQPADVKRVLRTFDFEERRLGNKEELPMHWAKVDGFGSDKKLSVGDFTWLSGINFEFCATALSASSSNTTAATSSGGSARPPVRR